MIGVIAGAMVIGAVASSLSFFQAQRRQLTGGDTILQAGLAGLTEIQRAVKGSGATINNGQALCSTINVYYDGRGAIADGASAAPVAATSGGTASDQLSVLAASSLFGAMPNRVVSPMPSASAVLKVSNTIGLADGDLFLVGLPNSTLPCSLMQVTQLMTTGFGKDIQHNPGSSGPWNPPNPATVFTNAPSYPEGSLILKVGAFNWLTYRIQGDNLEVVNRVTGASMVIAENVVGMRVWYGTSNGVTKSIEQWVAPTGSWATPSTTQIAAIRAVRIGLVLRNPEFVKPASGSTCDATANSTLRLWIDGPTFDVSNTAADWACYRYRTLNIVAPLRNTIYGEQT